MTTAKQAQRTTNLDPSRQTEFDGVLAVRRIADDRCMITEGWALWCWRGGDKETNKGAWVGTGGPVAEVLRNLGQDREEQQQMAERLVARYNAHDDLVAALREGTGHDRDVNAMRELSRRFVDNAPISGADKGAAAEIIAEYARFIRVARAALAKVEQS